MDLQSITVHLDVTPFVPFVIELDNGRRVTVRHPENVFLIPNRAKLWYIEVYDEENDAVAMFHPSAVSALLKVRKDSESLR
ncbi:MAG: hypothetical protein HYY17_05200 [Planctomycetes bacterium]|nr:hypothetical protein [Planctomycetota bacterium]